MKGLRKCVRKGNSENALISQGFPKGLSATVGSSREPRSIMVEVGGVEPPSETASTKLLRVYPAFDLARGMPTGGLILKQPFGYTNFGARAESSEASPAELCRGGLAGVCRATSGP